MRALKNDCSRLSARVTGFGRALSLLIENETSMALMNLSLLRDQVRPRPAWIWRFPSRPCSPTPSPVTFHRPQVRLARLDGPPPPHTQAPLTPPSIAAA